MKKILIGLLALGSFSSFAGDEVYCSKKGILTSYKATVELREGDISAVFVSSSNNLATRNGQQSETPYAYQGFKSYSRNTIDNGRTNQIILKDITDKSSSITYAKIEQSGTKHTLLLKGKGLPGYNRLLFKNCR